ncbi:hypothetical protein PLICRDRAFT_85053, partial [Plicaturopsis crispa FD-325 SS-3]
AVATACMALVDEYRKGTVSKGRTIIALSAAIPASADGDAEAPDKTLDTYIKMLDNFDADRERAGKRGRSRSHEEESPGSDAAEPPPKRQRADPGAFAWSIETAIEGSKLRTECRESLRLLKIYAVEPKLSKSDLLNSEGTPEFPDSEWTHILAGQAVDLDHVFNGRHSTGADDKVSHDIGEFTISSKPKVPSRTIISFGDWVIAWFATTTATAYAFPHRQRELVRYGEHVIGQFAAIAPQFHSCVMDYEKAVRRRVASRRDLLLTDFFEFSDLRVQFIDIRGSGSSALPAKDSKPASARYATGEARRSESCRRWNGGECSLTSSACRFRHVCSTCGSGSHRSRDC